MKKRYLIFISITLIIIISFWLGMRVERELVSIDEIGKPLFKKKQIDFPNKKASLFLKSKSWGLTGDHKVTVLSTNGNFEFYPDSLSEYIFHGFSAIIYKKENDTIKIYSRILPKMPPKFDSKINVELIQIENNIEWSKMSKKIQSEYQIYE